MLEKVFKLRENHTTVKTEILAGITTFMTMAYILAVNPNVLSAAGMDRGAVFTATVLASFLGTACMALFANYPFALAPGMGLNAYFAYTVVIGMGYPWQAALAAVFVEGLIFIVLSVFNVREAIFNSIPMNLKKAVSVGIGFFIAFIGLQNAKIVVGGATLVQLFSSGCSRGCNACNDAGICCPAGDHWCIYYSYSGAQRSKGKYPLGYSDHLASGHYLSVYRPVCTEC